MAIEQVGRLSNPVLEGKDDFGWLSGPAAGRPGRPTLDGARPGQ
jgi:hypothetical protein